MHNLIKRPAAFVVVWLLLLVSARADSWSEHVPTGDFDDVTFIFGDFLPAMLQTVFGALAVLAVLVTGFFLGRKWLRRVG